METIGKQDRLMAAIAHLYERVELGFDDLLKRVGALERGQEQLRTALVDGFVGVDERFRTVDLRLEQIDGRLDALDKRVDGLDKRVDGLDKRVDGLDKRMDGLDKRMDGLDKRMDHLDKRVAGLDRKVAQLNGRFDVLTDEMRQRFRVLNDRVAGIEVRSPG